MKRVTVVLRNYRDHPDYVGATIPGKMCVTHYSAGIALYPKEITLEAFSIIVAQMLGLSLGMSYDDTKKCHCSGAICIMNPEAIGILQFENVSYGIEPLESAVEFQHLLYKLKSGNSEFEDLSEDNQGTEQNPGDYNIFVSEKVLKIHFYKL